MISGNNFPTSIRQHASTAYYDSFIVAGGINSDTIYQWDDYKENYPNFTATIDNFDLSFRYQKDTDSWVQLNITMSADDYAFLSIMIAEDICLWRNNQRLCGKNYLYMCNLNTARTSTSKKWQYLLASHLWVPVVGVLVHPVGFNLDIVLVNTTVKI